MPDITGLIATTIVPFLFKLVGAVALWIVGGWLIQFAMKLTRGALRSSSLDATC